MNARMKAYADEWLTGAATGKKFNHVAAAQHAGYSTAGQNPSQVGSKVFRHPEVQEYIRQRLDSYSMSAMEVLLRFTEIARAADSIGDVVKIGPHGTLVIDPQKIIENKQFIKQFGFDSNGSPKVEFHDTMQALRDIARIRGMLKDGLEVSGPGGGAVPVAMSVQFVDPDGSPAHIPGNGQEKTDTPAEDFSDIEDL